MSMQINKKTNSTTGKKVLISLIVVIVLAVIGYGTYAYTNSTWPFSPSTEETAGTPSGNSDKQPDNEGGISNTKGADPDAPTPDLDDDVKPSKPTGEFVSNHSPNLSGSPAPNKMSSTCKTTPGAKCQISFQKGSTIKSTPAQSTDSDGNVSWTWDLQDIGLTEGSWDITAIAINGSKKSKASDSMQLVVGK